MVRECRLPLSLAIAIASSGCSLVLDFSDSQIPIDAAPDAPYTQEQCMYKEPNDSVETAMPFDPSEVGPAAICMNDPEDRDFYRFTVPANTASVQIKIDFLTAPKGDLDLLLLDAVGTQIAQSRGFQDNEQITCPGTAPTCVPGSMLAPGDYIFEVQPGTPGSVNPYDIALIITPM